MFKWTWVQCSGLGSRCRGFMVWCSGLGVLVVYVPLDENMHVSLKIMQLPHAVIRCFTAQYGWPYCWFVRWPHET